MKILHLINRTDPNTKRPIGISKVKDEMNTYMSCCWDFDLIEAKELIGGMIYFHETKSEKSKLGGRVLDIQPIKMDEDSQYHQTKLDDAGKRQQRVMFKFETTPEGRNQKWRGQDHAMSWTSGIVDVE